MSFIQRYTNISDSFAIESIPVNVNKPNLLLWHQDLVNELEIPVDNSDAAQLLSGNLILDAVKPVALAYSGHQFGHFNPTLGDGRAHLLGAFIGRDGTKFDIQLKGSGRTPFSRGGDGLCALGPAIREFVMSQAMAALKVPTTYCLSVVMTGGHVERGTQLPGAVVCRIARSHIRVGSFQYLALHQDKQGMSNLMEEAINSHFPHITSVGDQRVIEFLSAVCSQQVELVIHWLRVGFIHGVMNTDNTLVSGETVDYGPCAMMEAFDFDQVYSSIDSQGRYAFGNQPNMVNWNCARLAESLLLLLDVDEKEGATLLSETLSAFAAQFNSAYRIMWANKLGILQWCDSDDTLLSELLQLMQSNQLDYTNTFAALTNSTLTNSSADFQVPEALSDWFAGWQKRIAEYDVSEVNKLMTLANPIIIPRNSLMEQVIEEYYCHGNSELLASWLKELNMPYRYRDVSKQFTTPMPHNSGYHTFCGT